MTREAMIAKEARSLSASVYTNEITHNTIYDVLLIMADYVDSHPKSPWISVEDRLPEKTSETREYNESPVVIICFNDNTIGKAYYSYSNERWESCGAGIPTPIYWMPIPELPKGGEK